MKATAYAHFVILDPCRKLLPFVDLQFVVVPIVNIHHLYRQIGPPILIDATEYDHVFFELNHFVKLSFYELFHHMFNIMLFCYEIDIFIQQRIQLVVRILPAQYNERVLSVHDLEGGVVG